MSVTFLHVGPVKTGSTFIQDLLWTHRDDLAKQGVLLPIQQRNEMWLAANDLQGCESVHFDMPEARGAWSPVVDRVLQFDGASLISHEVLGLSTEQHVARIVDSLHDAQLHVVVMARSLVAMLPSLWQEKVKD